VATVPRAAPQRRGNSGIDVTDLDPAVRPQDDLFRYVNGRWSARTDMPADRVSYGALIELSDRVERDLHRLIEDANATPARRPGSPQQQIADLYASMTNEARLEALGADPIRPELRKIDAIANGKDLAAEAGYLASIAAGGPFGGSVVEDASGRLAVYVIQGGTLLPDRDYYVNDAPRFASIRAEYQSYLAGLFALVGRADPDGEARAVIALETELAKLQTWQTDTREPTAASGSFTLSDLNRAMPGFDWAAWARPQGIDRVSSVILSHPPFFKAFADLVPTVPLATWRAWLAGRYITAAAPYLSDAFANARFEFFGRIVTGQEAPRARWKRGVSMVSGYLGDAVGRLYVARHFPPESRERAQRLVTNVVAAFRLALGDAEWMTPATRRKAIDKLTRLSVKVGYPEHWRDYAGLVIKPDDLLGNMQRAQKFENDYRMQRLAGLADPRDWLITPQTVNAYYNTALNEMVLPAAMLQPPLFDPASDDAVNYGAIGAVVGHEIGHGFDQRGRQYDGNGRLHDWWTADDERAFERIARGLVDQYSAYVPLPGVRVNGVLALTENFGDLAGLLIAHRAYRLSLKGRAPDTIDGLTGDQRFFIGWAQAWRSKMRDEYLRQWILSSPHAAPEYRTNGTVANVPAFYEAFGVRPGDRLWRDPSERVRIW
jgi:putative endopeptidase